MLLSGQHSSDIETDPEMFKGSKAGQNRSRLANAFTNFFREAKVGDLVVMPEPTYNSTVRVGMFLNNEFFNTFHGRYGNIPLKARSIRWGSPIKENTISSGLSASLRNQHPFTLLERSSFLEVLALQYDSFVIGDRHVSNIYIEREDYTSNDNAFIATISKLAAAACQAIDSGQLGLGDNVFNVVLSNSQIEYTCSQVTDIHSPGFSRLISGKLTPLVTVALISAFVAMSAAGNNIEQINALKQNVVIGNTLQPGDDPCRPVVLDAVNRILSALDIAETLKLCDAARQAKERAGLNSSARSMMRE